MLHVTLPCCEILEILRTMVCSVSKLQCYVSVFRRGPKLCLLQGKIWLVHSLILFLSALP